MNMSQNTMRFNVTNYPKIHEFVSKRAELKVGDSVDDNGFRAVYCGNGEFIFSKPTDVLLQEEFKKWEKLLDKYEEEFVPSVFVFENKDEEEFAPSVFVFENKDEEVPYFSLSLSISDDEESKKIAKKFLNDLDNYFLDQFGRKN